MRAAWPRSGAVREDSTVAELAKHSCLRRRTETNVGVPVIGVSVGCGMDEVISVAEDMVNVLVNGRKVTGESLERYCGGPLRLVKNRNSLLRRKEGSMRKRCKRRTIPIYELYEACCKLVGQVLPKVNNLSQKIQRNQ